MEMVIVDEVADTRWSNHANSWTVEDARNEPRSLTNVGFNNKVLPTHC
jgi:hypothetical protein